MAKLQLKLPDFGQDWFADLRGKYIILSHKKSDNHVTMFFKPHCLGYTDCLLNAGIYTEAETIIHLDYYGDDISAIPCTRDAFATLGLYPVVANYDRLKLFAPKIIAVSQE